MGDGEPYYTRTLTRTDLTLAGIGHILGAGVFVLIGKMAGYAGYQSWMSVLLAAGLIWWLAQSFVRAHKKHPHNRAEEYSIRDGFGPRTAKLATAGRIAGQTLHLLVIALAFGAYLNVLFPSVPVTTGVLLCIAVSAGIAAKGIRQSSTVNNVTTAVEAGGIWLVIALGAMYLARNGLPKAPVGGARTAGMKGVLLGAAVIVFAYIGFETIVRLSEESKNPDDVSMAIKTSVGFTTLSYLLVTVGAITLLGPTKLAASKTPFVDIMRKLTGSANGHLVKLIAVIATVSTFNTYLMSLVGNTRLLTGFAQTHGGEQSPGIAQFFATIHPNTSTPVNTTAVMSLLVVLLWMLQMKPVKAVLMGNAGILLSAVLLKMCDLKLPIHEYRRSLPPQ